MSVRYVCDCCGEQIYRGESYRVLRVEHHDERARRTLNDHAAHYHDNPCWAQIDDAIRAREGTGLEPPSRHDDARARRALWKDLPVSARERVILETIGDRRVTNRGIWESIRSANPDATIYLSDVTALTGRLRRAGEIVAEREPWKGRTRNRFHRRTDLDGPIADLDRAFRDNGGTAA